MARNHFRPIVSVYFLVGLSSIIVSTSAFSQAVDEPRSVDPDLSTSQSTDIERIQKFFRTPQGLQFQFTQNLLQFLNPRKETRIWDESSIFMSLTPMFHAQRHMTLSPIGYEESLKDELEH